jgi:hypothetical protein
MQKAVKNVSSLQHSEVPEPVLASSPPTNLLNDSHTPHFVSFMLRKKSKTSVSSL